MSNQAQPNSRASITPMERESQHDLSSTQQPTQIPAGPMMNSESATGPSASIENQSRGDPPAYSDRIYTAAEMDAKLLELDHELRRDTVSTFREFEKVLKRTRKELAEERLAREEFEETAVLRINQLQAMVDELTPRIGLQRRGAIHARRNERVEGQRQRWEAMMWHD